MPVTRKDMNVQTEPTPVDAQPKADPATGGTPTTELARLREENARLRAQLDDAERGKYAGTKDRPVEVTRPSFGVSEGERADLEQNGVTTSPFTGEQLTASGEGITPANPEAEQADKAAKKAPEVTFNDGTKTEK